MPFKPLSQNAESDGGWDLAKLVLKLPLRMDASFVLLQQGREQQRRPRTLKMLMNTHMGVKTRVSH